MNNNLSMSAKHMESNKVATFANLTLMRIASVNNNGIHRNFPYG